MKIYLHSCDGGGDHDEAYILHIHHNRKLQRMPAQIAALYGRVGLKYWWDAIGGKRYNGNPESIGIRFSCLTKIK